MNADKKPYMSEFPVRTNNYTVTEDGYRVLSPVSQHFVNPLTTEATDVNSDLNYDDQKELASIKSDREHLLQTKKLTEIFKQRKKLDSAAHHA